MDRTEKKKKLMPKKKVPAEERQEVLKDKDPERTNIGVTINKKLWIQLRALALVHEKKTGYFLDKAIEEYLKNLKGG